MLLYSEIYLSLGIFICKMYIWYVYWNKLFCSMALKGNIRFSNAAVIFERLIPEMSTLDKSSESVLFRVFQLIFSQRAVWNPGNYWWIWLMVMGRNLENAYLKFLSERALLRASLYSWTWWKIPFLNIRIVFVVVAVRPFRSL